MNRKKGSGGLRPGAGRKLKPDPKVWLTIGFLRSQIEAVGGKENAKKIALKSLDISKAKEE